MSNMLTRSKRDSMVAAIGILVIIIIILVSFHNFSSKTYEDMLEINMGRLEEYTLQNAFLVRNKMEDAQAYVENAAEGMSQFDDVFSQEAHQLLYNISEKSYFSRMWIVSVDGICHSLAEETLDISQEEYYIPIREGKVGITQVISSPLNQKGSFLVYAPIIRDGIYTGSVIGTYHIEEISKSIELPRFQGEGYAHILQESGEIVIESLNENRIVEGDNAWPFYKRVAFEQGYSYQKFYNDIQEQKTGFIAFEIYGQERIANYRPVGINNWFIISIVPKEVITGYSNNLKKPAFSLMLAISFCFIILVAAIIYYYRKIYKEMVLNNKQLYMSNERLQVAVANTSKDVVEYDIENDRLYYVLDISSNSDFKPQPERAMEQFHYEESIEPEYKDDYKELFKKLQDGIYTAACTVKLRHEEGYYYWNQLNFTTIFDEHGKPVYAIGTIEDITMQKEAELRYAQEEEHRRAMLSKVITTYVFNLTKNHYMYGYDDKDRVKDVNSDVPYNIELKRITSLDVHPEDQERVQRELSLERFKREYERGNRKVEVEYRWLIDGIEQWVNCSTNLLVNPATDDIMGYSYIEDITEVKLNEIALRHDAERDMLTELLNRQTINRLITEFLDNPKNYEESYHAYLLVDLDKFKNVNDTYGHMAGDELLITMAIKLQTMFRRSDLIGRLGGDEFVLFLKDSSSKEYIREKAQQICTALKEIQISAAPDYRISGSVGVSIVPSHGIVVDDLYRKADVALYAAKNAGRDQYKIYDFSMEESD